MILDTNSLTINGNCFELLPTFPPESVDMILTDPPYGMSLKPQRRGAKFHEKDIINDNRLDWVAGFFEQSYRVLKNNAVAMFFCSHHGVAEFITSAKIAGFDIKNLLVWDKGNFGMGGNWRPCHELVLICTKGRFVTKSNSLKTIIKFTRVHHSKSVHPTEKPIDLLEHLISEPDYDPKLILDPFMGSGTTGVAAMNAGRKFIGIELDQGYFDIALARIQTAEMITYAENLLKL